MHSPPHIEQDLFISSHSFQSQGRQLRRGFILMLAILACVGSTSGQSKSTSSSVPPRLSGGSVQSASFHSVILGQVIDYQVILPAGYRETGTQRYPVLYLLHGRGDTMQAWTTIAADLFRLTAEGLIPPVIAIMPDALGSISTLIRLFL